MSFFRQVRTDGGTFQCNFIQSYSTKGIKYYVNVVDDQLKANLLSMEKVNQWKIVDAHKVPQRVRKLEPQLEKAVLEQQQNTAMSAQRRIVLHVDDDPEDRELLEEALKKLDPKIMVRQVENGIDALSYLKQSKHLQDLPCLIVLDLNMPGMNGKEVLREIQKDEELASLPLVIFTTASEKAYKDLIEKEHVELLTKPSSPSELLDSAKKLLSHCQPS